MGRIVLSPTIADEEYLYRGVSRHQWDFQNNRISSAAYKDSMGVSVDRSGDRDDDACIDRLMLLKPFYAVGRLLAGLVRKENLLVKYQPTEDNEYHSEIHRSEEIIELTTGQARSLSRKAAVVFKQTDEEESGEPRG